MPVDYSVFSIDLSTFAHELLDTGGELVMQQQSGEHCAVVLQVVDTQHAVVVVVAGVAPPVPRPHSLHPPLLPLLSLKQSIVLLTKLPNQ